MKRAVFPGSFDPFTIGHYDIVARGLEIFDEIIIGIGHNFDKKGAFPIKDRESFINDIFTNEPRVKVVLYDGLTVDLAHQLNANFLLRGIRTVQDFEYERNMAEANRQLSGIDTVLLFTRPEYAHISSSLVRDLYAHGKDITDFLPKIPQK